MPRPQRNFEARLAGKIDDLGSRGELAPCFRPFGPRMNARKGPPSSVLITNLPFGATRASVGELPGGALITGPNWLREPLAETWKVAYVGATDFRSRIPSWALFVTIAVSPETPTLAGAVPPEGKGDPATGASEPFAWTWNTATVSDPWLTANRRCLGVSSHRCWSASRTPESVRSAEPEPPVGYSP